MLTFSWFIYFCPGNFGDRYFGTDAPPDWSDDDMEELSCWRVSDHLTRSDQSDNHAGYLYIIKYFYTFWHSPNRNVLCEVFICEGFFYVIYLIIFTVLSSKVCNVWFWSTCSWFIALCVCCHFWNMMFSIFGTCMPRHGKQRVIFIIVLRFMQQSSFQRVK